MRRRHVYPHELGCELAAIYQFPAACQRAEPKPEPKTDTLVLTGFVHSILAG